MTTLRLPDHEVEFLRQHDACSEALEWLAVEEARTLEDAWQVCPRSDWMLWLLDRTGAADDALMRHLAVDFAGQVQHLMPDERSRAALVVARRYANRQATADEVLDARADAWDAAWAAAEADADAAAAWAAARTATWAARAASGAAWSARSAGSAAYDAAAEAAAWAAQANFIRARIPHAPEVPSSDE